ncbi:hypothetical protein AGMMS49940_24600 [Spirochaetia bacterium]|nr:hypothetical protein AGMMS49940_24600 [Spirochaetia bacterium]
MTFGERMKELLEQGAVVSREFAVKAGEKAQDWGSRGLSASREFAAKAGAKAQELGEIGVLKLEIKQFEGQAQKLIARLGYSLVFLELSFLFPLFASILLPPVPLGYRIHHSPRKSRGVLLPTAKSPFPGTVRCFSGSR